MNQAVDSPWMGRLLLMAAAMLWSLSGAFSKLLSQPCDWWPGPALHDPPLAPLAVAFWRVFLGGVVLTAFLPGTNRWPQWRQAPVALSFAFMNATFVGALVLGPAATATLLQYSAPFWIILVGPWLLREAVTRSALIGLAIALPGVAILVWGSWGEERALPAFLALASGFGFAGVLVGLRYLRDLPESLITKVNLLVASVVLVPVVVFLPLPTYSQLATLMLFGVVQMAIPYLMAARGLKSVTAGEAGLITLIEPVASPLWAYMVSPATETPTWTTLVGGVFIVAALAAHAIFSRDR